MGILKKSREVQEAKKMEKEYDKLHQEELARCIPIARQILEIMARNQTDMGDITNTQPECYKKIAIEVQTLFLDKNLYWVDRHFVFQLLYQVFEFTKELTLNNLEKSFEFSLQKLWGDKTIEELNFQDIDRVMKELPALKKA